MTWLWIAAALLVGSAVGFALAAARRQWMIARHTRCMMCDGSGCFNHVRAEELRQSIAAEFSGGGPQ